MTPKKVADLAILAFHQDGRGIKAKLKEIVPEYQPFFMENDKNKYSVDFPADTTLGSTPSDSTLSDFQNCACLQDPK